MVTVNNSDYYNNIPAGRDLNNLPNNSNTGTTVGYQYDGLTEEDRFCLLYTSIIRSRMPLLLCMRMSFREKPGAFQFLICYMWEMQRIKSYIAWESGLSYSPAQ